MHWRRPRSVLPAEKALATDRGDAGAALYIVVKEADEVVNSVEAVRGQLTGVFEASQWTCSPTSGPPTAGTPARWPPGCGRGRSTSSSARSTSSAPASCSAGCSLADRLNSLIFYGPPGCGKTALAHVIANHTKSRFSR